MTASSPRVLRVGRPPRTRFSPAARVWIPVLVAALVMHGCHGADVDHEPLVEPPETRSAAPERAAD